MKINKLPLIMILTALSCQPGDDSQDKKEELKNVVVAYYDALAKKDLQKLNSLTTANFVLFDDGVIYNNESAVKSVEALKSFTVVFSFDSLNVQMYKTDASAYYFRKADFVIDDSVYMPVKFLESATFNKEDNQWKLRFIHSSLRK